MKLQALVEEDSQQELEEDVPAGPGLLWIVASIVMLVVMVLAGWALTRSPAMERPEPELTSRAAELSSEARSEANADLQVRLEALDRVQSQIFNIESHPLASAVPAKRAQEIARQLASLESVVADPDATGVGLRQARDELDLLWKERFQSLQEFLASPVSGEELPVLPPLDLQLLASTQGDPQAELYSRRYQDLRQRLAHLQAIRREAFNADLMGRSQRLRSVILLRYKVLQRLADLGSVMLFENPERWFEDVGLELRTYPLRKHALYLMTMAQLEQSTGGGVPWMISLAMQVAQAALGFLLVLVPMGWARRLAAQPRRANSGMLAWGTVWVLSWLSHRLLAGTVVEAADPLISLLAWYSVYRAYGRICEGLILPAVASSAAAQTVGVLTRARRDLRRVGKFVLMQGVCTTLAQGLAGFGLLLTFVGTAVDVLMKLLYLFLAWSWRAELAAALARPLPSPLGSLLTGLCRSRIISLALAPLMVPLVALLGFLNALVRWSLRFDWGKRLSAGVLRRWIEIAQESEGPQLDPVPSEYSQRFLAVNVDELSCWSRSDPTFRSSLETLVQDWAQGEGAESRVAVHGPSGSGRDAVQAFLTETFAERLDVVVIRLEQRTQTEQELLQVLAQAFEVEGPADVEALARQLDDRPLTLAIIPDAHRLFLACVGAFGALRALSKLMSRCRRRIFWCPILSTQSLVYLRMLVPDLSMFTLALRVPRWNESALRQMLIERHQSTGRPYRLSQAVLRAAEATPGASAEDHYFQVLLHVCKGNPKVARDLFLDSARIDADGTVVVGLPNRNPVRRLTTLPATAGYLLSAVMRHEDLTLSEAVLATGLPENSLYQAWERCLEIGILVAVPGSRVVVARRWLADVAHFLKERNLLDGE